MKTITFFAVLLVAAASAHASATSGSIGFATPLLSEANASPTGDINTSTMFTLENLSTTDNASGLFAGLPIQSFGTVTFDTTVTTSLHISDGEFGSFASQNMTPISEIPGFFNLLVTGTWTPGTFSGLSGSFPADFRISFTQSQPATGEISFSGTMFTQIPTVPEPSTWFLFLTGVGMILAGAKLRSLFGA